MATKRLASGDVLNVLTDDDDHFTRVYGQTLIKTESLEVARLLLPAGKHIAEHQVTGELTLQCLSGAVSLHIAQEERQLNAGDWVFLAGNVRHSLHAQSDSVLLLSLLLNSKRANAR